VLAYANGFTLWHYKSGAEGFDEIGQDDFFREADDMLAPGDLVMISGSDGARIVCIAPGSNGSVITQPLR
jgi:hypothetical protein